MGLCEYYAAIPCNGNDFSVSVDNEANCANTAAGVSCVDRVRVTIPGGNPSEVLLSRSDVRFRPSIHIDGDLKEDTGDDTVFDSSELSVVRTGGHAYVTLKIHGVRVLYDGYLTSTFQVSTSSKGDQLCGQCGTYNDNPDDDFTLPDGTTTTSSDVFGESWEVPGCTKKRDAAGFPGCDDSAGTVAEAQQKCSAMMMGSFAACNEIIDPTDFISNCEFDYCCCAVASRDECYCSSLSNYALACSTAGVTVSGWRDETGCGKLFACVPITQYITIL